MLRRLALRGVLVQVARAVVSLLLLRRSRKDRSRAGRVNRSSSIGVSGCEKSYCGFERVQVGLKDLEHGKTRCSLREPRVDWFVQSRRIADMVDLLCIQWLAY